MIDPSDMTNTPVKRYDKIEETPDVLVLKMARWFLDVAKNALTEYGTTRTGDKVVSESLRKSAELAIILADRIDEERHVSA